MLSRLYDKVLAGVAAGSFSTRTVFKMAFDAKLAMLRNGIVTRNSIWDKIVFKKIQSRLGGCVRVIITGAAPIDHKIIDFLRIAAGCHVFEGYGQTGLFF